MDSPSNASWFPWIQKQLLLNGVLAQTPEMPQPWDPNYEAWSNEFVRFDIKPDTILVGHSCGVGFLLRWLSEHNNINVGKVVLVAPWIDPDGTGGTGDFFKFKIDPMLSERTTSISIFSSDNDFPSAQTSTTIIRKTIHGLVCREFNGFGHFTELTEFLELSRDLLAIEQQNFQ